MPAFDVALADGAQMVELDVWLTSDGVPVVHHDGVVGSRRTPIGQITRADLISRAATPPIPALADVLAWARGRIGVYVDLKGPATAAPVAQLVRELRVAPDVVVGARDPDLVAGVRDAGPEIPTSILRDETEPEALLRTGLELGVDYLHPCWKEAAPEPHRLLPLQLVDRIHGAGLGVITWDEDRPLELEALVAVGPDAICTNSPASLAAILRATASTPCDPWS